MVLEIKSKASNFCYTRLSAVQLVYLVGKEAHSRDLRYKSMATCVYRLEDRAQSPAPKVRNVYRSSVSAIAFRIKKSNPNTKTS